MVNFVTVQIPKLSCAFSVNIMGGENQRRSLTRDTGYSETAQCTGKPSYLEPISGSLQKPVEGLLVPIFGAINKGGGLSRRATEQLFIQQPESTKNCTTHSTATRSNRKDPIYESTTLEKVNINPQVKG